VTLWNAAGDVVAFIDGSDESWRGFEWAHDEALRTGRNLVAVHVDVHGDTSDSHDHDLATEVLTEAAARLAEEDSPVVFSTMRRPAPLRYAVQDLSRRAGLVVVGSGSRHLLQPHATGRTHSLLGRTTCPMVVVTASRQGDADGVVTVGVSLSPGGLAAMRFACTEARLSRRTVVGVRAWADQDWKLDALGGDYTSVNDWRAVENFTLEHWLDHARFEFDDVAIEGVLVDSPIYWALEDRAPGSALVVVGARRTRTARLSAPGPVTGWAVQHAPGAIAVVPFEAGVNDLPAARHTVTRCALYARTS
jgi:nucleotide-binding universal stress UspA family protein